MKVRALKTFAMALNCREQIRCVRGQEIDINPSIAKEIVDNNYGEYICEDPMRKAMQAPENKARKFKQTRKKRK